MKFAMRVDFIIVKRTSSKFLNLWDTSKDVTFVIFRGFSSRFYPLNVTWQPENKGAFALMIFFLISKT